MVKKSKRGIIGMLVLFALVVNTYIALGTKTAYAKTAKAARCEKIGCPDDGTRLCGTINLTLYGAGVVYYCYEKVPIDAD